MLPPVKSVTQICAEKNARKICLQVQREAAAARAADALKPTEAVEVDNGVAGACQATLKTGDDTDSSPGSNPMDTASKSATEGKDYCCTVLRGHANGKMKQKNSKKKRKKK